MSVMIDTFKTRLEKNAAPVNVGKAIRPLLRSSVMRHEEELGALGLLKRRRGHFSGSEFARKGMEAVKMKMEDNDSPTNKMIRNQNTMRMYSPTSGIGKHYRSTDGARNM